MWRRGAVWGCFFCPWTSLQGQEDWADVPLWNLEEQSYCPFLSISPPASLSPSMCPPHQGLASSSSPPSALCSNQPVWKV